MNVSNEQLTEFMRLHRARYGKSIGRKDALDEALQLLRLLELIAENRHAMELHSTDGGFAES